MGWSCCEVADLASSIFGSFVAVTGDAHQAKVAQERWGSHGGRLKNPAENVVVQELGGFVPESTLLECSSYPPR